MARYKLVDRSPRFLPVVLAEQIQPGTFEFALDHLVDHELDRAGQAADKIIELHRSCDSDTRDKMATSKGVIQGYAAQAAVDSAHQVIVAAEVTGSGSEQSMLLPMAEQVGALRQPHTFNHGRCRLPQQ